MFGGLPFVQHFLLHSGEGSGTLYSDGEGNTGFTSHRGARSPEGDSMTTHAALAADAIANWRAAAHAAASAAHPAAVRSAISRRSFPADSGVKSM